MNSLPKSISNLIDLFSELPGIGRSSATRIVLNYFVKKTDKLPKYIESLEKLSEGINYCEICDNFSEQNICQICSSSSRKDLLIIVVESPLEIAAFEELGITDGKYHVIGELISPVNGIGPDQTSIGKLDRRIRDIISDKDMEEVQVIVALSSTMEGDVTTNYIKDVLSDLGEKVKISTLARGLPSGTDLNYTDKSTLKEAYKGRVVIN